MAFSLTSPVTGGAQTGLTSPTYTIAADTPPDAATSKQYVVTALGGTQTGVTVSSVSSPFTTAFFRPRNFQYLGKPNPVTGIIAKVPMNVWKHITRHGVLPLAGQSNKTMVITTIIEVPAGSDIADNLNVRAALSLHYGVGTQATSGIGDTVISGVLG